MQSYQCCVQGKRCSHAQSVINWGSCRTSTVDVHLHFTLNVMYLVQLAMTQTSMTFLAKEALTQLRAMPILSQDSPPQGCPLQGLVTQALRPQALKTLTLAPQALLTRALMPQGEMDLELGPQAHQDQSGLTATSVSAFDNIRCIPHCFPSFRCFLHSVGNVHFWLPYTGALQTFNTGCLGGLPQSS